MGAQMNIKSEEAYALASEIARRDGVSLTQVVVDALRAWERNRDSDAIYARALEICRDTAPRLPATLLSIAHGDLLYDENGLPA
ncbi:type II toxin-antitoxin system VapB family antitoxin [Sphingomonas sp.]|uniref:type II toxin-antitoxin system VapB family antitoxin n=1 Tax=Sphingomonas sp. TaxID=28214 RepID=UPI00286C2383|nr:type II toxin-antitoxin system VapB family antitoxin [Sphingomonas sp.]